jgi:hypothetical protein
MKIDTLHIGMKVRHPQYGVGVVKSLTEQAAEIAFDDTQRTIAPASSDLQPAEATATLSELEMPLANLIRDTAHAVVEALGSGAAVFTTSSVCLLASSKIWGEELLYHVGLSDLQSVEFDRSIARPAS